jgi:spore maturation protein CgeB
MRVLYVGMAHDYGDPTRGPSFEEMNFRSALEGMGHEVVAFDFMDREAAVGREAMNRELAALEAEIEPDVAFFILFKDEIAPATIRGMRAPTVNWFADDHWRFADFTSVYAPAFDWSVTTDHEALPKYHALGVDTVVLSQWACNRYAYSKVTDELEHDVTFVGQPHGDRVRVVERLRDAGIAVECWGHGWPNGKLDHDGMVETFGASRLNLNLANSSTNPWTLRMRVGAVVRLRKPWDPPRRSQIKGRTFEVPGSGGFLLTDRVPYLEEYFEIGREISTFDSTDDLIDKVRYWLGRPEERAAVADAGFRRVLAEHTYDHRFAAIFERMGLGSAAAA